MKRLFLILIISAFVASNTFAQENNQQLEETKIVEVANDVAIEAKVEEKVEEKIPTQKELDNFNFKSINEFKDDQIKKFDITLSNSYTNLSSNPQDNKSIKEVEKIYSTIQKGLLNRLGNIEKKLKGNKEEMLPYYQILTQFQHRFNMLNKIFADKNVINKKSKVVYNFTLDKDYAKLFETEKLEVVESRYQSGLIKSASSLFTDKMAGVDNFKTALYWIPNYKNTQELLDKLLIDSKVYVFLYFDKEKNIYDNNKVQNLIKKIQEDEGFLYFVNEENLDAIKKEKNIDAMITLNDFNSYIKMANLLTIKNILNFDNVKIKYTKPKTQTISSTPVYEFRCDGNLISELEYYEISNKKVIYDAAYKKFMSKKFADTSIEAFLKFYADNEKDRIKVLTVQEYAENYASKILDKKEVAKIIKKTKSNRLDVSLDIVILNNLNNKKPTAKKINTKYFAEDKVSWVEITDNAVKLAKLDPIKMRDLYDSEKNKKEVECKTEEQLNQDCQEELEKKIISIAKEQKDYFLGISKK